MPHLSIIVNPNDANDIQESINALQKLLRSAESAVKVQQPDEEPRIPKVYSGNELRKLAAEKAKQIGAEKVKAFVASLGLKTITEVAPEDSAEVYEKLRALQ
jgi:phosphatidylserine/phosphatidylglycerophosphate/cardiolipin synthase-like enzyme